MKPLSIQPAKEWQAPYVWQKFFLISGIMSSLLYVVANVVCAMQYEGYSSVSQTVSELSAIGAPTRQLWVTLLTFYSLLIIAFGFGIWQSAGGDRSLRIVAILLITDAIIGFFWPPMHQREVLAAGGGTWTDTWHIIFTFITVPLMMLIIGFAATVFGKKFMIYSIITLAILVIAGIVTGVDGPKIQKDLPTPWIGVWERINIGAYMLWVIVFAFMLLKREKMLRYDSSR